MSEQEKGPEKKMHPTEVKMPLDSDTHVDACEERYFRPAVDIYDHEDAMILVVDMPGVTQEQIELSLHDDELVLTGKVKPQPPGEKTVFEEYRAGGFHRHFDVYGIDPENVKAKMTNGVLKVVLRKQKQFRSRKIVVE